MKRALRKQILAKRDRLTPGQRTSKSREIEERLFSLPEFKTARTILFFASFRSEVETAPMVRRALVFGKRVILPKVAGTKLDLFEISNYDTDVSPGAWGIPEPREPRPVGPGEIDLIIVPGAAFDCRGNRLGYGAGFYDKLLAHFTGTTVALAFEAQIVAMVPADLHDIPVGVIVTEKRTIDTKA